MVETEAGQNSFCPDLSNVYLSDYGMKESTIICRVCHAHLSHWSQQTAAGLLKGQSCNETHVTQIQEADLSLGNLVAAKSAQIVNSA